MLLRMLFGHTPQEFSQTLTNAKKNERITCEKRFGEECVTEVLSTADPETVKRITEIVNNMWIGMPFVWTFHQMNNYELRGFPTRFSATPKFTPNPLTPRLHVEISRPNNVNRLPLVTICQLTQKGEGRCAYTHMPI